MKRTPLKRTGSLKKTGLKRRSAKKIESDKGKKARQEQDWLFYLSVWKERPHRCEETGRPLGYEPLTTMFHHILPKEENKFPQYRYKKWNIALLHPEVHDQAENDLDKTPKTKEKYLYLLEHHENLKNL